MTMQYAIINRMHCVFDQYQSVAFYTLDAIDAWCEINHVKIS